MIELFPLLIELSRFTLDLKEALKEHKELLDFKDCWTVENIVN